MVPAEGYTEQWNRIEDPEINSNMLNKILMKVQNQFDEGTNNAGAIVHPYGGIKSKQNKTKPSKHYIKIGLILTCEL